ncbi:hypothetical protein KPL74_04425 [Bacillus sp. NP157]|nr:hypothetical protein KPL74_04425 [Bacillus sp. NP157]
MKTFEGNAHVFAKYAWLALYHNHFCDTVVHASGYAATLKVNADLAHVQFRQIVD